MIWQLNETTFEPSHEIMVLFILRKLLFFQTRSHPVGLDVWFVIRSYIYHYGCIKKADTNQCLFVSCLMPKYHSLQEPRTRDNCETLSHKCWKLPWKIKSIEAELITNDGVFGHAFKLKALQLIRRVKLPHEVNLNAELSLIEPRQANLCLRAFRLDKF